MDEQENQRQLMRLVAAMAAEKKASVSNKQSEPEPSVTNKRRATGWESRNKDKVREQTNARVKKHRAGHTEQYREYMREYMRKRRASASASSQ